MSSGSETRQRKTQLPPVRCTEEEAAAIRAAVSKSGLSYPALVRFKLTGRAGPRTRRQRMDVAELGRLLAQAGKIGSNINQLAHVANSKGDIPSEARLDEIWQEVNGMRSALLRALGRGD